MGRWDPNGRFWCVVRAGDTFDGLSLRYYRTCCKGFRIRAGNPGGTITPVTLAVVAATRAAFAGTGQITTTCAVPLVSGLAD